MAEHDANREPQPIDEEAAWAAIVAGYGEEPADPPGAKPFKSVEDLALLEGDRNGPRPGSEGLDAGRKTPEPPELLKPAPSADPAGRAGAPAAAGTERTSAEAKDTGSADTGATDAAEDGDGAGTPDGKKDADGAPGAGTSALGSSVTFAPGVGGPGIALPGAGGPRDYRLAEPEDGAGDDEGHFVPPEPPPLPESDVTSRFAWLAVIGGPVLMLIAVLLSWDMTWWLTTLCIGGFLGGFATLVARMDPDDDGSDDPGRGAVV
ncbi:hypothetical protein [Streptomyces sp. NPDC059142]|uniref:hypothetical protein n=1 Tax=Streptomyces sp. NPDC059142 TaxID=3346739 RepID=UPI0036A3D3D1